MQKTKSRSERSTGKITPRVLKITKDTPLKEILSIEYECRQCAKCCSYGSGYLVGDDAKKIAAFLDLEEEVLRKVYLEEVKKFNRTLHRPKLLKEKGKPFGQCVFLKGNTCSIHDVKPLHCRISNYGEHGDAINEWFHLNYFVDPSDPTSLREWFIHVQARGGDTIDGGRIDDLIKDKSKLQEVLGYGDLRFDEQRAEDKLHSQGTAALHKKTATKNAKSTIKKNPAKRRTTRR